MKIWKREENDILGSGSPYETLGFSKERNYLQIPATIQNFLIKPYNFNSIEQVSDIKKHLLSRKILIINAESILNDGKTIEQLKEAIEELKVFLKNRGGSIGRIGDKFLVITPNSSVKISN
jgi:SepF-like predicted cell division protein (DUF552 family)